MPQRAQGTVADKFFMGVGLFYVSLVMFVSLDFPVIYASLVLLGFQ